MTEYESDEGRWDYTEGDKPESQTQSDYDPEELERARIRMKAEKDPSTPYEYQKGQEDINETYIGSDVKSEGRGWWCNTCKKEFSSPTEAKTHGEKYEDHLVREYSLNDQADFEYEQRHPKNEESYANEKNPTAKEWWEEEGWKDAEWQWGLKGYSTHWNELSWEQQDTITKKFNAMLDEEPTLFESHATEKGETYIFMWRKMDTGMREQMLGSLGFHQGIVISEANLDWEELPDAHKEALKIKMNELFRESASDESIAIERDFYKSNKEMNDQAWEIMAQEEFGKSVSQLTDKEYKWIEDLMNDYGNTMNPKDKPKGEAIDGHTPEEMIKREHELMGEQPKEEEKKIHQQLKKEFGDEESTISVSGPPAGTQPPANIWDELDKKANEFEPERQGRKVKINKGDYAGKTGKVGAIPLIDDNSFFVRVDGVHNEYEDGIKVNVNDVTFLGGELYEIYEQVEEVKVPEYKVSHSEFAWESLPHNLQTRLGRGYTKVTPIQWGTMTKAERTSKLKEIGESHIKSDVKGWLDKTFPTEYEEPQKGLDSETKANEEVNDPKDIKLLDRLLDNELEEEKEGEDEEEDIAILLQLLAPNEPIGEADNFKEEEHPRDQGGQFTSKGVGTGDGGLSSKSNSDLNKILDDPYSSKDQRTDAEKELNKREDAQKLTKDYQDYYTGQREEDDIPTPKPREEPITPAMPEPLVDKPKNQKKFDTIKSKILQDMGDPTEGYYQKKKDIVTSLKGFPTNGGDIEGLGVRYKAPIMKLHLQEKHPNSKWSVRTEYFSGGSAINAHYLGGEYPYGASEIGSIYSQTGAGYDPQTDYFPIDNYVSVYDGRPYEGRPRGDPQTIAKTRDARLRSWIDARLENVDYRERTNWSWGVAKDLVEKGKLIPYEGMTEDHKAIITNTWNEFKEQERKENAGESYAKEDAYDDAIIISEWGKLEGDKQGELLGIDNVGWRSFSSLNPTEQEQVRFALGNESYKKKAIELDSIYNQFTDPLDAPTGKNIMDSVRGYSEPEANGQDISQEEIIEKTPPKIEYQYYKQYPFGRIQKGFYGEVDKTWWKGASYEEKAEELKNIGFGMGADIGSAINPLVYRNWEDLPNEARYMWGDFGKEVKAIEVELSTMYQAHKWWDDKYPDRQWKDMNIGERQRAIMAFLRDPDTSLESNANEVKITEITWKSMGQSSRRDLVMDAGYFGDSSDPLVSMQQIDQLVNSEWNELPDWFRQNLAEEGGVGSGRKPYASKDPKRKDKAHVGWKNQGIQNYLDKAEKDYISGKTSSPDEYEYAGYHKAKENEEDWEDKYYSYDPPDAYHGETRGYYKCNICSKGFDILEYEYTGGSMYSDMKNHLKTKHGITEALNPNKCAFCGTTKDKHTDYSGHVFVPSGHVFDSDYQHTVKEAKEGGKGSGKKGHQQWMRSLEEDPSYVDCPNCKVITEKINGKCQMCGKKY